MCFEPCSKRAETCCLCCLKEKSEVLLKAYSFTDLKNMFQGTYKDTGLTLTETVLFSFLSPTLNVVLFAEALLEATTQGIIAQFFHSRTVANSILFVGKPRNFAKKDFILDLTLLVKYMKACPDIIIKTSKYWLLTNFEKCFCLLVKIQKS